MDDGVYITSISLPRSMAKALDEIAEREGVSRSQLVRSACFQIIEKGGTE